MRQVFAVFAALAIMFGSTLTASAQQTRQTTVVNGMNVSSAQVGGIYSSTMSRFSPTTYSTSLGMSFEIWKFDGTFGRCVDITMRSATLAPALQSFDNSGFAPVIMQ